MPPPAPVAGGADEVVEAGGGAGVEGIIGPEGGRPNGLGLFLLLLGFRSSDVFPNPAKGSFFGVEGTSCA